MTPASTSNELDVQNEWEENTQTHTHKHKEGDKTECGNYRDTSLVTVVLQSFSKHTVVLTVPVHLKEPPTSMGPEPAME